MVSRLMSLTLPCRNISVRSKNVVLHHPPSFVPGYAPKGAQGPLLHLIPRFGIGTSFTKAIAI
jgi:hypothetical protein